MSIHERLPRKIHRELKEIGWTKAADLATLARRQGEQFDCATWLHKARETPKDKFHDEIEKLLTGSSESSDLVYFKLYKSQIPVVEQALEIAARMLGSEHKLISLELVNNRRSVDRNYGLLNWGGQPLHGSGRAVRDM